jgi:hypothetical protein
MVGVYHKCEAQHLQQYLNEFAFRHNNRSGLGVTDGNVRPLLSRVRTSKPQG